MSAITQWTTPALWTLSVLCLTSRAPVEAAYAAPVLLIVDLFNRSRSLSYARTGKSEYVRQPTGKEKRKVRRLNGETEDPIHVEQVRETGTRWSLLTMVNLALTLALLEPLISSRLITCPDVQYARTSALSNDSARISLRLPGYDQSAIEYRPLVPGYPWTSTIPFHLESSRDWTADVSLDHLQPGIQYEYRAEGLHGAHNFTTFPDSRLESPFRFVFAGQPQFAKQPFRHISHNRQATWAGWLHQIKLDRVRSSAWAALGEWLDDMDGRTAWAATRFALIGNMPKGTKMRQLVASSGKAFERLPILPSRVKSPFNADPEPAALTVPESHFSYGKVHVFRLQYPHREPHQDDQDWRVDVADLERKLASYNTTDWKFIVTPSSLAPFFSAPYSLRKWQDAVLDVLAYVPNVVVLTESSGDFRAEILRRDVIQVTSPSLDGGRHQEPDLTRAREEPVTTYITATDGIQVQQIAFEKVDRLLRQFPAGRANWLTVEIHGARTYVVFVRDSQPIWRLEIVGEQPVSRAVGTVAQSLQNILRRLGLSTTRWF